jgi:hypothetical protein
MLSLLTYVCVCNSVAKADSFVGCQLTIMSMGALRTPEVEEPVLKMVPEMPSISMRRDWHASHPSHNGTWHVMYQQ